MHKREYVEEKGGSFRGKGELLKHLSGDIISARQAIVAKCYECMGYYADGKQDCKMPDCPLYPWMVYKEGGSRKMKRNLTDEQKKAVADRLRKTRSNL